MNPGTLYLIPASLGDPKAGGDAALVGSTLPPATRAIVHQLEIFGAENAKSARAFLKASGTRLPIQELTIVEIGHAPKERELRPLLAALEGGRDVGLLPEAGCPAIADPGAQLARMAHEAGIRVVPMVGPSALLLALMASGLDGQRFAFNGYLPVKDALRADALQSLEARSRSLHETQIAIETPYRNEAVFNACLATLLPSTRMTLAIDLTLPGETVLTHTIGRWRQHKAPPLSRRQVVFLFLAA